MEGPPEALAAFARRLLAEAKAEGAVGFAEHDDLKIRKAAERAWKAAVAATDAAMAARGIPRDGTGADRVRHYAFLDTLDGGAHALAYASFADRLHRLCAHDGHLPTAESWESQLRAVDAFIAALVGPA